MAVFVDTSAFYAVLCANDPNHAAARQVWQQLLQNDERLITTNYILLETLTLLQHRLGVEAVRVFQEDIVPWLGIEWIAAEHHQAAVTALIISSRRALSLTVCSSFEVMRRCSLFTAFTFDTHFKEQGFTCLPA
jgi:predicted nucleic acid-binding protein